MRLMRSVMLGAAILAGTASWAAAQSVVAVQYYDRDDRQAFREGYRHGQWDARHGRAFDADDNRWREADDRHAFREGYARGYREVRGGYGYSNYGERAPAYSVDSVRRIGFEDGLNDGAFDRRTGHSFRPTHDDNFRHADRGYYPGSGNKDYYKQLYREGYENGYRQGYDNAWRR